MIIYRYSQFKSKYDGHGGEKRTYQLEELFVNNNIDIKDIEKNNKFRERNNRFLRIYSTYQLLKLLGIKTRNKTHFKNLHTQITQAKSICRNYPPDTIFLYEHSRDINWFFPIVAKKYGHKVIAAPHNLETLVPNQKSSLSNKPSPEGFFEEMKIFSYCDIVLTISKEENWLLQLFNANSIYFPYNPPKIEAKQLEQIKKLRSLKRTKPYKLLILGSYSNPPTRKGMDILMHEFCKNQYSNFKISFAGYFTEQLAIPDNCTNINVEGSIRVEDLYNLYRKVDAVIINQANSTGALTKIPELLLAGIPIVANTASLRNYYNINGITLYNDINELGEILNNESTYRIPNNYKADTNFTTLFKQIIAQITSNGRVLKDFNNHTQL